MSVEVRAAASPEDLEAVRLLFREYQRSVDAAACFEGFERELATLAETYAPPAGRLLLAVADGAPAGCVALRPLGGGAAEVRRLFVRSAFRGRGLGGALMVRVVEEARAAGHALVRLETVPDQMAVAVALYRALGFREVPPWVRPPVPGALYMELTFGGAPPRAG